MKTVKTLLLANGASNGARAGRYIAGLCDYLALHVANFTYRATGSGAEMRSAAREATEAGVERVLVAGGDGTVHEAVNGLVGSGNDSETALGIIPIGTGNDIAASLGVPSDPFAAANFLLRAPVTRMDIVRAGEEVYAGVGGAGYDSAANRLANSWPTGFPWPSGHFRYWLAGFVTAVSYEAAHMEIIVDGERIERRFQWVAIANTPRYGGGIKIAPHADCRDGLLDICLIEPMGLWELMDLYPTIFDGGHESSPRVRMLRAREVEIKAPSGGEVYGDGELLGRIPMRLRVEPGALRVLARG